MVPVQVQGGETISVDPTSLWWTRAALESEIAGTVLLRLGDQRLFSIEALDAIKSRFAAAGVRLVQFTAPAGPISPTVNADAVVRVEPPDPVHPSPEARAVLKFSFTVGLAVRETVPEAQAKIAKNPPVA
jgi:hypothetical protein